MNKFLTLPLFFILNYFYSATLLLSLILFYNDSDSLMHFKHLAYLTNVLLFIILASISLSALSSSSSSSWSHALSMYGDYKYGKQFSHFEYANPDAPKGGVFKQATIGSFDSLNSFIVKGNAASGSNMIYDTLLKQSSDEPFTGYGLIASSIKVADDFSSVSFKINPNARFHDGINIQASDVKFSLELLLEKGAPFYRSYYAGVKEITIDSPSQVSFYFSEKGNRELPLIVGQIPIFPEHFWKDKDFSKTDLTIPLGSSAYKIKSFSAGKRITYERVKDYWAKDLPVNKGIYNFDSMIFDYYRDAGVAFEAFKSGAFDYRLESSAKRWATGYKGELFESQKIITQKISDQTPQGMQGFWFNLRNDKFKDKDVRKAISLLFDFEWANKTLFHSSYTRINSFYSGSELATAKEISADEALVLAPYKDQLASSVFDSLSLPVTRGDGNVREQMRRAVKLFEKAGYQLKDSKMQDKEGKQFTFEFLLYSKDFERIVHPFRQNLQRVGIKTSIRLVDVSQFINRLNNFDFDIVTMRKGQSISPGNEQLGYWGCDSAMEVGTSNWSGVCLPVLDKLVQQLITSRSRKELVSITKALDRVLLNEFIVIPQWYLPAYRIAYWNKYSHPDTAPIYELGLSTWWLTKAEQIL